MLIYKQDKHNSPDASFSDSYRSHYFDSRLSRLYIKPLGPTRKQDNTCCICLRLSGNNKSASCAELINDQYNMGEIKHMACANSKYSGQIKLLNSVFNVFGIPKIHIRLQTVQFTPRFRDASIYGA